MSQRRTPSGTAGEDIAGPAVDASKGPRSITARTRVGEARSATARLCRTCGHVRVGADAPCDRCGTNEPAEPRALVVDGRYTVVGELGHGGMGIVYLAQDAGLDRFVALKMIAPRWLGDDAIVASFQREAKALASVRSQYVVQVHAFGVHDRSYFFAMEYVRGKTLRQILLEHRDHGQTVPQLRSLTILSCIGEGLDAVHAAGIVHRDVKPSNIVIEEETGRPVLVDFGLAVPAANSAAARAIATPQYMAPEQAGFGEQGAQHVLVGPRADVYALGIVAFEMLTGRLPFQSNDVGQLVRLHAKKRPPSPSSVHRELAPFDAAIARALSKNPADRHESAGAFARELASAGERWTSSNLSTLPPPPDPQRERDALAELIEPPIPSSLHALRLELASASSSPLPATAPARDFRALVVDDSAVFRKFTVQATQLALFRYDKELRVVVDGAGSGEEALARAAIEPPDLVLLDFDMPGLDGVDTLARLRAMPGGEGARVVVLSGRVAPADRWRFAVLGVNHFVAKPIDFRQLVDRIEGIAKRIDAEIGIRPLNRR